MLDLNYVLLYVESPAASAAFYTDLIGKPPVESSPTFALFVLDNGLKLGFWSRHTVEPSAAASEAMKTMGGGSEIAFSVVDNATVDARYAEWQAHGLRFLQIPTELDFGYTFVALDPDNHRLRVFAPAPRPA